MIGSNILEKKEKTFDYNWQIMCFVRKHKFRKFIQKIILTFFRKCHLSKIVFLQLSGENNVADLEEIGFNGKGKQGRREKMMVDGGLDWKAKKREKKKHDGGLNWKANEKNMTNILWDASDPVIFSSAHWPANIQ